MKKYITVILILLCGNLNSQSVNDSLLIEQLNAIKGICKEINTTNKRFKELVDKTEPDNIQIDNLLEQSTAIENLNDNQNRIIGELINRINQSEKPNTFWNDAGVEAVGALLGILGTLLFFIWGLTSDKRRKEREEKIFKKERVTFGGNLVGGIIELGNKQNVKLQTYLENSRKTPLYIPALPFYPSDDIERISKLFENQEFFHAFLNEIGNKSNNQKDYKNIVNGIDYLNSQYKQLFDIHEKAMRFDHERKMKYKDIVADVLNRTSEFTLLKSSSHKKLVATFDKILIDYARQNEIENSILTSQNYLIEPLKQVMLNNGTHIPDIREIIPSLTIATQLLSDCYQQNEHYFDKMEEIKMTINEVLNKLESSSKEVIKYRDENI